MVSEAQEDSLFSHRTLSVEVLSPVHIGDGTELLRDYDYVTHRGRTYVVNQDVLVSRLLGDNDLFDGALLGRPMSELLHNEDFNTPDFFRYQMPGLPMNRPLKSQIKNTFGNPYLPGSTLKGLLRTLLMWGWYVNNREMPDVRQLQDARSWAAQPLEHEIFGKTPNTDFLRAMHITDSQPVALDRLDVASISIYPTATRNSAGVVVDVEAIRAGTIFESRLSVDEFGFTDANADKQLHWAEKRVWMDRFARIGQVHAGRRLAEEVAYFKSVSAPDAVLGFYNKLIQIHQALGQNEFLAQVGWGAGWNSKTLNDLLTADKNMLAHLVHKYKLTRDWQNFTPGDLFPSSRHLALREGKPFLPVGWIRVTIS